MNKSIQWFTDRIGAEVMRNNKAITINNEKEARYHYSLQTHFRYTDPVVIHTASEPSYCEACQG